MTTDRSEHPDPRIRALEAEISRLGLEERAHMQATSARSKDHVTTDWERTDFHRKKAEIAAQKLVALDAMSKVDPAHRAYEVAKGKEHAAAELAQRTAAADHYDPTKTDR